MTLSAEHSNTKSEARPRFVSNDNIQTPSFQKRFIELDGLRAIFCIGIVLYHVSGLFDTPFSTFLCPVYHYGGYFGNYIFFMISGFLISFQYKNRIYLKEIGFTTYIFKRIIKIYPLYFLSNFAMIPLMLFNKDFSSLSPKKIFTTFFMLSNGWFLQDTPYNLATWFICVLIICYILYYLVVMLSRHCSKVYILLCIFLTIWGAILEIKSWNIPLNYRTNGEGYMNFFTGAILAEILIISNIKRQRLLFLNYASLIIISIMTFLNGFEILHIDTRWVITLICVNLICIAAYGKTLGKLLSLPLIQKTGKISMSIYMWHIPFSHYFYSIEQRLKSSINPQINLIIYLFLLILISQLSYCCFQKKHYIFRKIKNRLLIK